MLNSSRKISLLVGTISLLTSLPSPIFCDAAPRNPSEGKKTDAPKEEVPDLFNEFVSRANLNSLDMSKVKLHPFSPEQLNNIHSFFREQLKEGGPLSPVREAFESGAAGQVGFGFLMGYSSGFCLRKVSRIIAFGVGGVFIIVQSLSYSGLIEVKYDGLQKKVETALDLNKDGKVDAKDAQLAMNKIQEVLGHNMPVGGGFTAGFLVGLRGCLSDGKKDGQEAVRVKQNALLHIEEVLQDFKQRKKQLLVDICARLRDLRGSHEDG
eukprot:gene5260-5794_t